MWWEEREREEREGENFFVKGVMSGKVEESLVGVARTFIVLLPTFCLYFKIKIPPLFDKYQLDIK